MWISAKCPLQMILHDLFKWFQWKKSKEISDFLDYRPTAIFFFRLPFTIIHPQQWPTTSPFSLRVSANFRQFFRKFPKFRLKRCWGWTFSFRIARLNGLFSPKKKNKMRSIKFCNGKEWMKNTPFQYERKPTTTTVQPPQKILPCLSSLFSVSPRKHEFRQK
jgi:hypothetical protein